MKAVAYYRISTRDKQDIGMQEKAVRDYCERENIELIKEYSDIGESGKKESRPKFDLMLEDMRTKLIDCIIVYKLDRIGRSLSHLVKLFEEFNKKKIDFISITQSINTTTPEGRMFLHILMVLSEYERELTISRINTGLKRAKSEGKILGRPKGAKDKGRRRKSGYYQRWSGIKKNPKNYRKIRVNGKNMSKHRKVMEDHLGRKLLPTEIVHHIDGNRVNNVISNLILCKNEKEHRKHHKQSIPNKSI